MISTLNRGAPVIITRDINKYNCCSSGLWDQNAPPRLCQFHLFNTASVIKITFAQIGVQGNYIVHSERPPNNSKVACFASEKFVYINPCVRTFDKGILFQVFMILKKKLKTFRINVSKPWFISIMFSCDVLRFWPREQLIRKFFAASLLLLMLFSIFLFGILISENERFSKEIEGNRETKQEPYIGTKAKPRSLHQSDVPQEDSDIFYVDSEPKNVVADDQLQIVTSHPVKKLPNVLIIGVKKSGTKALVEFLKIHPDVSAPANEIHYFSRNFHKGLDWYRWALYE